NHKASESSNPVIKQIAPPAVQRSEGRAKVDHHAEAERPGQPSPARCPIDPQRRRASDGRNKAQHFCFAIELTV
ncbi:hypothetical protein ILYODFUR_039196, partial [Ilyodon furcidens]